MNPESSNPEVHQSTERKTRELETLVNDFAVYSEAQKKLRFFESEDTPEDSARKKELLRATTAYHARVMDAVLAHREAPNELAALWRALAKLAMQNGDAYLATSMRRGVLSQVATYRILAILGHTPAIATPDEDAFRKVDMWEDLRTAVQVKWSRDTEPQMYDTDALPMPAVAVHDAVGERYIATKTLDEVTRFRAKLQLFAREGRSVHGHFLVIPDAMMDQITGEPSGTIIEFVKKHIGAHEAVERAA